MPSNKIIVIALGGNALNSPEKKGGYPEQVKNAAETARKIARTVKTGREVVITHGNGPQVGNILLQQEYSKEYVLPMPLSVCGAQSQGQIGSILAETLNNEFRRRKIKKTAIALVTHVLVNQKDPAFKNPTKFIGPIFTQKEARKLKKQGQILKRVQIGAYRRVVPSPPPLEILELKAIKSLLDQELILIACGGGGIPVFKKQGKIKRTEAVIDKDLASQVLANQLKAEKLIILTNVKGVALNYQKPNRKWIKKMTLGEAKEYTNQGHFPPGSMGPKMAAVIKFLEKGGKKAVIAHLNDLESALKGESGTTIVV